MTVKKNEILGQIIKRRRILEGYTQLQASRICGVSVTRLSQVERGLCLPSAEFLIRIAGPLNIDESILLTCAACLVIDEPKITDRALNELSQALKIRLANNHVSVQR